MKEKFKLHKKTILYSVPIIVILISIYFYIHNSRYVTSDNAYIKLGISSISSQVNGVVKEIKVSNNQEVKENEPLVVIEDKPFRINLENAKASLDDAKNQVESLRASIASKKANLESAKANLEYYEKQYQRMKKLAPHSVMSKSDVDDAKRQYDNALQEVINSEETLKQELAKLDGDMDLPLENYSIYVKAKADLEKAQFDLDNTVIYAPFNGVLANFYLKEGSYLNQGVPLFSVIDTSKVWVEANLKETELTNVRVGQKATIIVDSFPDQEFEAKVTSITRAAGSEFSILPAQNTSGNWVKVAQRIMIKLEFATPSVPLASGMSAFITIDTKSL